MAEQTRRQRGAVTDVRPGDDRISGGKEHSVQTEARGEEGAENISNSSASSGGAAGRVDSLDTDETRRRAENSRR